MPLATLNQLEKAQEAVYSFFQGTNQYCWPLVSERAGCEVWVKHENHTPIGAFKVRGGLVYMADRAGQGSKQGLITATRGNHGQSIATAASLYDIPVTIVVPKGNSVEKNAAMQSQGGKLIKYGDDFQEAAEHAADLSKSKNLFMLPSFHELLVQGVGTYAVEFFKSAPALEAVYVPIGLGSGICGVINARDALGLKTKVIGVVAEGAPAYALSFDAGKPVSSNRAETIADGMACRVPIDAAIDCILSGADRVVQVSDADIKEAMRIYYTDTHNVAEGAGAAPLAALLNEKHLYQGKKAGVVLTGGNVDKDLFTKVMGETL